MVGEGIGMNVDIEKVEKFVSHDDVLKAGGCIRKHWLRFGVGGSFFVVLFYVIAFMRLSRYVNIYPFFLTLLLIPVTIMLAIKLQKNSMNTLAYEKKPHPLYAALSGPAAIFTLIILRNLNIPDDTFPGIMLFFALVVLGLFSILVACGGFYKVYLIRKYAPYFKDERLRGKDTPTEPNL